MTTELMERLEPYSFSEQEPSGLTSYDGAPGEAGADWATIWEFQLPAGYTYIYDRSSIFAAYLAYVSQVVDAAMMDDGGAFTDETADARDAGTGDVEFVAATPAASDAFYFGFRFPFQAVTINFSQAGTNSDITWVWEYYNGSSWASLTGLSANSQSIWEDGTGNQTLSFTVPSDWAKTLVDQHHQYFIRARISAMNTDFTAVPQATTISIHGSTPEIANTNLVRVVWTDPNQEEERRLGGAVRYQRVREYQQASKLHRLDIADRIVIPENYIIKVQAKAKAPIDASSSGFMLVGQRGRLGLEF